MSWRSCIFGFAGQIPSHAPVACDPKGGGCLGKPSHNLESGPEQLWGWSIRYEIRQLPSAYNFRPGSPTPVLIGWLSHSCDHKASSPTYPRCWLAGLEVGAPTLTLLCPRWLPQDRWLMGTSVPSSQFLGWLIHTCANRVGSIVLPRCGAEPALPSVATGDSCEILTETFGWFNIGCKLDRLLNSQETTLRTSLLWLTWTRTSSGHTWVGIYCLYLLNGEALPGIWVELHSADSHIKRTKEKTFVFILLVLK